MDNFSPSARSAKNGPGPGTPPYWGLRVLTACAGLITLPCFRLSLSSGFCFRASVSGPQFRHAPSLLYLRPHRRRQGPARHHQEGCVPSHRPLRLQMDPLATGDKELRGTGSWRFPASFCKAARHHLSLRSRCLFCDPTRWPSPWVALACLLALPPPRPVKQQCHASHLSLWQPLPPVSELFWDFVEHWLASPALTSTGTHHCRSHQCWSHLLLSSAVLIAFLPSTIFACFHSRKQKFGLYSKDQAVITTVTYQQTQYLAQRGHSNFLELAAIWELFLRTS